MTRSLNGFFHNLKLRYKLTLAISFLCLLALTIFSTTTIIIYKNILMDKEIRSTLTNLEAFRDNLNNYLNGIDKSSVLLIYSTAIQDHLTGNPDALAPKPRLQAYRDIHERIREITNNSYGISSISIVDNYSNVFTFGESSSLLAPDKAGRYPQEDWFVRAAESKGLYQWEITNWSASQKTIQMVRSIQSTRNQQTLGVVIFTISPDILKSMFNSDVSAEGEYSLVVGNGEIYSRDESDVRRSTIDTEKMSGDSGHYTSKSGGRSYLVTYSANPLTDWKFIYTIDRNVLFKDIYDMYIVWAALFLASFVPIGLVSIAVSRSISRPLKTLTQLNEEVEKGNLYVKFLPQYADEVGMLGASFNRMLANIREGIPLRREKLIRSILEQNVTMDEFRELNRMTALPLNEPFYQVALVDFPPESKPDKLREWEDRLFAYEERHPLVVFTLKPGRYGVIFNVDANETANIAAEMSVRLRNESGDAATVYIGGQYAEIHFVKNSFEEAKELTSYRFFSNSSCIRYDEVMAQMWQTTYPEKFENRLKYYIEQHDAKQCGRLVDELLDHMRGSATKPFILQTLLANAYIFVNQQAIMNGVDPSSLFGPKFGSGEWIADNRLTPAESFAELLAAIDRYIAAIKGRNAKPISAVIAKAVEIIDREYREFDIGIEYMAQRLNMNGVYFSQLFKKDIGISFIDYLNRARLESARRLLAQSNLKIKEVALEVGYEDSHYFGIWFKDKTGLTPSQYRNQEKT